MPRIESAARRLSIVIALARVSAAQGNFARARSKLQSALNEAYKLRSVPHQLEIRSALCEFDSQSCTRELEKEARDKGFLLIADKVATLRGNSAKPTPRE